MFDATKNLKMDIIAGHKNHFGMILQITFDPIRSYL